MAAFDKTQSVSQRMSRSVMNRYEPPQMKWHYEHGLVLQSIFLSGQVSGQDDLLDYVKTMFDTKITQEGEILTYRENEFNLDQINPGKVLFLLLEKYGEEKYRIAIEKLRGQLKNHPRTKTNGFWHKQIYPFQMWLDGLYMQAPFYAQYTAEYGPQADFEDITHQFTLIYEKAVNKETGLLYHAWDESIQMPWANPNTGCSPHFWGRAMGWYCMALVDTMEFIPASQQKEKEALKALALSLIDPLINFQDQKTGIWYQVLDKGSSPNNYTESSASSMFTYFLLKILRMNLVPQSEIQKIKSFAIKAYKGLLEHKLEEDADGELHLTGICKVAGLGGTPYRDGSYEYYVSEPIAADDFKGVGPFILASIEYELMKSKE